MVFIHTRATDDTTTEVIQWLLHYRKKFFRLNSVHDLIQWSKQQSKPLASSSFQSCYLNGSSALVPRLPIADTEVGRQVGSYLQEQAKLYLDSLVGTGKQERSFGHNPFLHPGINKLTTLEHAAAFGLKTPPTAIVTTKAALRQLKSSWGRIINKSIHEGIAVYTDSVIINGQRTEEVTDAEIERMGAVFFPSLIQQLIPKQFEIRVFFFREQFYAQATFTQNNAATHIDGRVIDTQKPSREVPFRLPEAIKKKISLLMKQLQLNYGSLDFIYTIEDDYCFLEVNPYG